MAENRTPFLRNLITGDTKPLIMLGLFQAGATQAIKRGELLELDTGNFVPLDADQSMAGVVAIAAEEIKSGDRAGYYRILVPRPGDVFEFELAAAGANAVGTVVYWSDSETVTITAGSNQLGTIVSQDHYPQRQGHLADDASPDQGTSVRSASYAGITILAAASYYAALQE